MAFEYAYGSCEVRDFKLNASYDPKKGGVGVLNASGEVVAATSAATAILGVVEGQNFRGITEGGKYEPTTVTENTQRDRLAKVRTGADAVYRIPFTGGTPVVGAKYGVTAYDHTAELDAANTTTGAIFAVIELDSEKGVAFVQAPTTFE